MLAWVVIDRQQPRHFRNSRPVRALPLPSSRFYFQSKIPTGSGRFNVQMSPIPPCPGFYSHFGSHPSPSLCHNRHPLSPLFSCTYEMQILQPLCFQLHACNGGGALSSASRPHILYFLSPIPFPIKLLRTFLRFFALFCTHAKLNSFIFNRFRTLCKKPPGVGGTVVPARFAEKGTF